MESDLRTYILSDSTISTLIGNRLYVGLAPESDNYPYCILNVVSTTPENTLEGYTHVSTRIILELYTDTYSELRSFSDAIQSHMDQLGVQTVGGTRFVSSFFIDEGDTFEYDTRLFYRSFDFLVQYKVK